MCGRKNIVGNHIFKMELLMDLYVFESPEHENRIFSNLFQSQNYFNKIIGFSYRLQLFNEYNASERLECV